MERFCEVCLINEGFHLLLSSTLGCLHKGLPDDAFSSFSCQVQLVVSVLAIVCPPLFEGIAEMEEYHPRVALKWQLWRLFALFLANLYSLVLALYTEVNKKIQEEKALKNTTMWALKDFYGNSTELENGTAGLEFPVHPGDVPRGYCWESALGIEFMKLAISDIQVTYMTIFIADFLRAVAVRFLNYCWCWDLEMAFPSYAEFDISGNVLTLVFSQGMIWVGAFFSPGLLGINVLRLVSALYFQTWAVMCCNIPHKKVFKISKSNNFYMGLLLLLLFLSVLPVVYAIMTFPPSSDCGPFSGKEKIYDVITETIEQDFPAFWTTVFGYAVSPGVMILVLLLLALIIYYLKSVLKSYRKANEELRRRLQMQKDEERKQRNNIDSTNHLMDDLEELLPKRTHVPLSTKESIEEMTGNSLKLSQESETVLNERQGRFQNAVTRAPGPRVPGPLPGMALPQIVSPGSGRGRGQVIRWY